MSRKVQADLVLVVCAVCWGGTFVVVKDALADSSVFVFLALRFVLAALVLTALQGKHWRAIDSGALRAGALIGVLLFAGFAFQTSGLKFTTPSKSAFITGTLVVLVPLFLMLFGKRRISVWIWAGVLAAAVGLYFLTVPPSGFASLNLGDVLTLFCAAVYATYIIAVSHFAPKYPASLLVFLQVAGTAILSVVAVPLWAAAGWESPRVAWTPGLLAAIAGTAIITTAGTLLGQVWAQKYAAPSHTALILTLEPVCAAVISYFVEGERLGARATAGAALILMGILLAELKGGAATSVEPI
jgi:drug/metabolite transporter (DMT)-like permease